MVGFLVSRLISRNDQFQDETNVAFKDMKDDMLKQCSRMGAMQEALSCKIDATSLTVAQRNKLVDMCTEVDHISTEITLLRPTVKELNEFYGRVINIEDLIQAQDKKLRGLYIVVEKAVKKAR
ncbi:MAG: hypothetical protein DRI98_10675 [Bacteroidetes bacterium]|nr:MAG: hypothetical protein DRI98_10675 [Bacteroidota bacterium]